VSHADFERFAYNANEGTSCFKKIISCLVVYPSGDAKPSQGENHVSWNNQNHQFYRQLPLLPQNGLFHAAVMEPGQRHAAYLIESGITQTSP